MPPRKLSAQDVDDLRIAWEELKSINAPNPRQIERPDGVTGQPVILRIGKDLARWKNISEARFNELKAGGFVLKRGLPKSTALEATVQDAVIDAVLAAANRRIFALENENEQLRRKLEEH